MLSPRRSRGKEFTSLVSKRITPRGRTSSSASKYVITPHTPQMPHTPQERDVGLTLAALARNSKAGGSSVPSTDEKSSGSRVTYSLTFPELVHKMVTETVQRNSQIIRWTHDGEAFSVNHKVRDTIDSSFLCVTFAIVARKMLRINLTNYFCSTKSLARSCLSIFAVSINCCYDLLIPSTLLIIFVS